MFELFDKDFFKFTTGFLAIIIVSLFVLGVIGEVMKSDLQHEAVIRQ